MNKEQEHNLFKKKLNQKEEKSLKGKTEEELKEKCIICKKVIEEDCLFTRMCKKCTGQLELEKNCYQSAKAQTIKEVEEIIDKIKIVKCAGMSKEFIEGSDWCNHIWKRKIIKLKYQIKKLGG